MTRVRTAAARTTAVPVVAGAVVGLAAACTSGSAATAPPARPAAVVIDCQGKQQVRPAGFVLACADGNAYLSGLRWSVWGTSPRATGTWRINDCTPICATGTFVSFPARVTLSRPEPLPGHPRTRYFTRITVALPAARCDTAAGHRTCYPARYTSDLWSSITHGLPAPSSPPVPPSPPASSRPPGPVTA